LLFLFKHNVFITVVIVCCFGFVLCVARKHYFSPSIFEATRPSGYGE
jgi:hypothetical protein